MIVVFVVDTSPSMARPAVGDSGMSRLDVAKMVVEDLVRGMRKRRAEHHRILQEAAAGGGNNNPQAASRAWTNLGLSIVPGNDALLLLSTSRQHPDTASCAAGGRLLVGFGCTSRGGGGGGDAPTRPGAVGGDSVAPPLGVGDNDPWKQHHEHMETFQRELKGLNAAKWEPSDAENNKRPFPEDGGGAAGLNAALSAGLRLLSRYRLQHRLTENFGMGRIPSPAFITASGNPAAAALQPAILVLITDGACLRLPPERGGGPLELQFGNQPLREFYKEPFRWDQRIFCLGVGGRDGMTSSQFFHPRLRSMCDLTGGAHWIIRETGSMQGVTESLLKRISPPLPKRLPLPDPLFHHPRLNSSPNSLFPGNNVAVSPPSGSSFANGGPICCFQALESDDPSRRTPPVQLRAMLLYTASPATNTAASSAAQKQDQSVIAVPSPPLWCIPEAHFASKKLDTLPPRQAQPVLFFSRYPSNLGSKSFEPFQLIKMLHRLDQLVVSNRKASAFAGGAVTGTTKPLLHRDVYACEWITPTESNSSNQAALHSIAGRQQTEYFPVFVPGAGRSLAGGEDATDNYLNIGILHIPVNSTTLSYATQQQDAGGTGGRFNLATLTLLPPEPHILLPLLVRAAETEHRLHRRQQENINNPKAGAASAASASAGSTAGLIQQKQGTTAGGNSSGNVVVPLDEHWRNEFRAYLFRLPPYYQYALKRTLRPILPTSAHSLLMTEGGMESLALQCFSKTCLQKIRNGEQIARDNNERMELQEASLKRRDLVLVDLQQQQQQQQQHGKQDKQQQLRYGQFDPRSSVDSYLSALRNMPPPWRVGGGAQQRAGKEDRGGGSKQQQQDGKSDTASMVSENNDNNNADSSSSPTRSVVDVLGDLPAECLMAYYESRRRWIFGGSGHSTRGLHVEGVNNDGSNSQRCKTKPGGGEASPDDGEECLLSIAGVGVSLLNQTSTTKMGDYRERLLFSRSPVVGYGSNDAAGVAITTGADGSPVWSVDDDALPVTFFDARSGEFQDSVQNRVKSRLLVNFGNPFKERRADSLVPERWLSQSPSMQQVGAANAPGSPRTPPGSPPHDSFDSMEEGEAVFVVRKSPTRSSPKREDPEEPIDLPRTKKARITDHNEQDAIEGKSSEDNSVEPPKAPASPATSKAPPAPPPPPPRRPSSTAQPPPPPPNAPPRHFKKPPAPPNHPPPKGRPGKAPPPKPRRPPPPKPTFRSSLTVSAPPPAPPPPKPPPQPQAATGGVLSAPPPRPSQQQQQPPPPQAAVSRGPPTVTTGSRAAPPPPLAGSEVAAARASSPASSPTASGQQQPKVVGGGGPNPQAAGAPYDLQNPDAKPNVNLPDGWICVWSKSQKRWYFFDTKTNKSVWKWPP